MGRGLGPLQRRVLAMANYNRLAEKRPTSDVAVYLVEEFDEETARKFFESIRFIEDRFRRPWRFGLQVHTLWDLWDIIQDSGLIGKTFLFPGTRSQVEKQYHKAGDAILEKLKKAGIVEKPSSSSFIRPEYDTHGRYIVRLKYKNCPNIDDANALEKALIASGYPADSIQVYHQCEFDDQHLTFAEGLADLFGFRPYFHNEEIAKRRRVPSGCWFNRKKIGKAKYAVAATALSKAFTSLESRNLVMVHKAGKTQHYKSTAVVLKPAGVTAADKVLAEQPDILADIPLYAVPFRPDTVPCESAANG